MEAEKSSDSQNEPQYISIKMEPVAGFEEHSLLETSHNNKDYISNDHFSASPAAQEKLVDQHSTDQYSAWTLRSTANEENIEDNQSITEHLNSNHEMPENVTPEGGRKRCSQCRKKFAVATEPHPNCLVHSLCFQNNVWDPRTCDYCNELLQQASAGDDLAQSLYKVRVRNMRQQAKRHHTYDHWIHSLAEGYLIDFKGVGGLEHVSLNDVQDASTAHTPNISAMSTTSSHDDGHYQCPAPTVQSRTSSRLSLQTRVGLVAEKQKKADPGQVPRKRCTQCPYRVTAGDTHPNCLVHSICFQNYTWDPRYCNLCNAIQDKAKQGDFAALDLCKRRCNNMIKRATLKGSRRLWIHPLAYNYLPPSYRGLDGLGMLLPEFDEDFSGNDLSEIPSKIKMDADHNSTSQLDLISQQYKSGNPSHSIASTGSGHRKKCLRCSWSVTSDDEHPNCTRHSDCFKNGIWKPRDCRYCLDLQSRADAGSKAAKLRLNKRLLNMRKCARKIPEADWSSLTLPPSLAKELIDPAPKDCIDLASREFIDSASKECTDSESTTKSCRHCLHIPQSDDPHPACTRHSACCRNNFWVPRDCQYCIQLKRRADEGDKEAQSIYKKRYVSMRMRAWRERIKEGRWIHPQCGDFLPPNCRTEPDCHTSEETHPVPPNVGSNLKRRCFKCCRGLKPDDPHLGCILHCDCFQKLVWDPRGCDHCFVLKQRALETGNQTYRARYVAMRKHAWNNGFKGWIHPQAVKDYRYNRRGGIGTPMSQGGAARKKTLLPSCPPLCSDGVITRPSPMEGDVQNEKRKLSVLGDRNIDARIVKFSEVPTSRDSTAIVSKPFADIETQLPLNLNVFAKPGPKSKKILYSNRFINEHEKWARRSVASQLVDGSKMVSGTKQGLPSMTLDLKPEPIVFTKVLVNGTSMNSSSFLSPLSDKTDAFYEDAFTSSPINSWNFKVSSSKLHFVFKDLGLESCTKLADKTSLYYEGDSGNSYSYSSLPRSTVADDDAIKILVVSIQKLKKHRVSPKFCRVNGLSLSCGVALKKQLRLLKEGSATNGRSTDDGSMSSETGHFNCVKGPGVTVDSWAWGDHTELSSTPSVTPFKELSHEAFRLPDGKYQCPICSLVVGTFVSYRQHYITHLGEKPFQCRQCSFRTRYPFQLKRHTIARHGYKASRLRDSLKLKIRLPNPPTSPLPSINDSWTQVSSTPVPSSEMLSTPVPFSKTLSTPVPFIELRLEHCKAPGKGYLCPVCGRLCMDKILFKGHYMTHSGERPFPCPHCPHRARLKRNLKTHIICRHTTGKTRGKTSKVSAGIPVMKAPVDIPQSNLVTDTPKSEESGPSKSNSPTVANESGIPPLSQVKISSVKVGGGKYKCPVCGAVVRAVSRFRVHYMKHSGERPFKCRLCPYTARRVYCLQSHWKCRHGKEPGRFDTLPYEQMLKLMSRKPGDPFTCPICGRAFSRESLFRGHYMRHSGERPFQCPDCSYRARHECNLKVHQLKIHGKDYSVRLKPVAADGKATASEDSVRFNNLGSCSNHLT